MDYYLKYLIESDTPKGRGQQSKDSPVEYLDILENLDKPHLYIPKSTTPQRNVKQIDYINELKGTDKPKRIIIESPQQIQPDKIQEYLQSFITKEEDEEPPVESNQVQNPDNKKLPENNIQLELKTIKTQMESLNKRYATVGGGGGTNAMQFANGGVMNGNLTVSGTVIVNSISASNYLGLSASGGDYVRKAGDIMTGSLIVPSISAANYLGMPSYVLKAGDTMTGTLFAPSISSYSLSAHVYDLSPDGTPTWREGRLFYDTNDHTLAMYTDIQNVTLQVGQEMWVRVVNKTGSDILNGTPVIINGAQGNRPTITKASAFTHGTSDILGVATHNIAHNATGVITVQGLVRDVNTDQWAEGTTLYLTLTAGVLSDIPVRAPYHPSKVGVVVYQHLNQGIIYVDPYKGSDIDELHDVLFDNKQNGDFITWSAPLSAWVNANKNSLSGAAVQRRVVKLTSSYTALSTDNTLVFTLTSAAVLTLPSINTVGNIEYIVKNKSISTSNLTISAYDSQTIDNINTHIIAPSNSMTVISDGNEWVIV
jgi:hypothetical protein